MYKYFWYETRLPEIICDQISNELKLAEGSLQTANVIGEETSHMRDSKNLWVPDSHWINGFCSHYVNMSNKEVFQYDIFPGFDNHKIQYSVYGTGCFYSWHTDYFFQNDTCRKLSFSLQLSDYDEYRGGDLQIIDDEGRLYVTPKTRGSIVIFDSRLRHRVRKVTEGERRSLVGWIMGPRWK